MSWYIKLKDIFKDAFPVLQSLININITVNSNNSSQKTEYNSNDNVLTINLEKLTPQEKNKLKQCLLEAKNEGQILLDKDSAEIVNDFKINVNQSETKETLDFLDKVVPQADIKIWRAALYIRLRYKQSRDIQKLKMDIIGKYGEKGKNITNLCSAGYIESLLTPNYNSLRENYVDDALIKEHFNVLYELVVYELTVTVFVHLSMKESEVEEEIIKKIEQNLKYGIKFLNIHGIGKQNVEKINKTVLKLDDICKKQGISIANKNVKQEKNTIVVRLEF